MHSEELHSTDEDPLYCRGMFPARSGNREMDKEIGRKECLGGKGGKEQRRGMDVRKMRRKRRWTSEAMASRGSRVHFSFFSNNMY